MANLRQSISSLKDPSNIKNALLASSPYVLRKVFASDPTILRIIAAGDKVIPLIVEETREAEALDEITLSAFTFIVANVKAEAVPQIFGETFLKSMDNPGPFFVNFAAHAIRSGFRMPTKPSNMVYSRAELNEVRNMLR